MPMTGKERTPPTSPSAPAAGQGRSLLGRVGRLVLGLVLTSSILVSLAGFSLLMMPVTVLTRNLNLQPGIVALYGSLREGRATLVGGYRLEWRTGPGAFHLETPVTLTGPDTQVSGTLRTSPIGLRLTGVDGRAGPGLARLVPGAWDCDMTARVNAVGFSWTWTRAGATGEVTTPEGTCRKAGRDLAVPPFALLFGSQGRDATATLRAGQARPMADVRLRRDRVIDVTIRPEAAEVFPQLPRSGPINLQIPF